MSISEPEDAGKDMKQKKSRQRRDRLLRERIHDPYKLRLKLQDPAVCPQCGAVYEGNRWRWAEKRPTDAQETLCQACQRINDDYPAGEVTLSGHFLQDHKSEILRLARNQEELEKGERPLHRIMNIEEGSEEVVITTTDIHLPRRIGEALHRAYKGDFDFHYDEEGYFVRVHWKRDD